ncbi:hypothetical protein DL93DRAFT_2089546 [Clavulina sp. PMI_390]|nr:hypothetical protein DL93DRAFT_2089546 [Clavulina sp. PMI_390]
MSNDEQMRALRDAFLQLHAGDPYTIPLGNADPNPVPKIKTNVKAGKKAENKSYWMPRDHVFLTPIVDDKKDSTEPPPDINPIPVTTYDGFELRTEEVAEEDEPVAVKESTTVYAWVTNAHEENIWIKYPSTKKSFTSEERITPPKANVLKVPELSFFTYKGVPRPRKTQDGEVYIFTGKTNPVVFGGYYMRFSDLSKRLDWRTAPEAYKNDLARLNGFSHGTLVSQYVADGQAPLLTVEQSSLPFPLWKDNGDPVDDPRPFLEMLVYKQDVWRNPIKDENGNLIGDDLKQFLKYLGLASAASMAQKVPYSVISRFWDIPNGKTLNQEVLIQLKGAARDVSLATINAQLKEYRNLNLKPTLVQKDDRSDYKLLGVHPLQLYEIWVHQTFYDYIREAQGIRRPFPSVDKTQDAHQVLTGIKLLPKDSRRTAPGPLKVAQNRGVETEVSVDKAKLLAVLGHTREQYGDQKKVMNGISATSIAKIFWEKNDKGNIDCAGMAEWLHRSAWSFGGVTTDPGSSQTQENLIFGTVQCNTAMIRYEGFLKRMAERNRSSKLTTKPYLDFNDDDDLVEKDKKLAVSDLGRDYRWLASHLKYSYIIPGGLSHASQADHVDFDVFSLMVPTRMEAILDEIIENLAYNTDV